MDSCSLYDLESLGSWDFCLSLCLFCGGREGNRGKPQMKWDMPCLGPLLLPDWSQSWEVTYRYSAHLATRDSPAADSDWPAPACPAPPLPLILYDPSLYISMCSSLTHLHLLVLWSPPIISKLLGGAVCSYKALYTGHSLGIIV